MRRNGSFDFGSNEYSARAGVGFLRFILLFGSAAVMLGLILVPLLMQRADKQLTESLFIHQPDQTMTGAIKSDASLRLQSLQHSMPPALPSTESE